MSNLEKRLNSAWLVALLASSLTACGGGGGNDAPVGGNPPAPVPAPPPPPPPASSGPPLSSTVTDVTGEAAVGERYWVNGNTSTGGQGSPVNDIPCYASIHDDTHTHISIILNGDHLTFPDLVGTPGNPRCYYGIHTRNGSGLLHVQTGFSRTLTLGDVFDIWGRPLTTTNVAGIEGLPVEVFVTDNGTVTKVESDWRAIELTSRRLITIGLGTPLTEIPNFTWTD
jgi:hypothetical protein